MEAAGIANANEFIQSKQILNSVDDSAEALLLGLDLNAHSLQQDLGKKVFAKKREIIMKMAQQERKEGKFASIEGAVDTRPIELKDITLNSGFNVDCGLRGNKLSGG